MQERRWLTKRALSALIICLLLPQAVGAEMGVWQPVVGPRGGSVAAVAFSPDYATDRTAFAGFRGQGVYRSDDGTLSWHLASPGDWVVIDLVLSPTFGDDGTLLAVQGLWTSGYEVHRSADRGETWEEVTPGWTQPPAPPRLAISPAFAADGTVYVAAGVETFVSTDGGLTFAPAGGWFADHPATKLAFSPEYSTDTTLFAQVAGEGLYRSEDAGATWTPAGPGGAVSALAVSPNYGADTLLVAVAEATGQIYLSADRGDSWSPVGPVLDPGGKHTLSFSPSFGPGDPVIVAASSSDPGAYRSGDGGTTWEAVGWYNPAVAYEGGFVGGGVQALTLGPSGLWDSLALAGTESGLYYSSDRGVHWWQGHDRGMPPLSVRAIATAPGAPEVLLAGTSFFHNQRMDGGATELDGALYLSVDGGVRWRDVTGRLDRVTGVAFSPAFLDDGVALATTGTLGQHGFADGGVYRSLDGGANWEEVVSDRICHGLAISPNFAADGTVWVSQWTYSAALGLFRSEDGGQTWQPLAPDVHAHVVAPSPGYATDQTLLAGTLDAGLQRSTDGGVSWSQVFTRPVGTMAVSPAYGASRTLYVGVNEPGGAGEIYRSTDGGDTWQRVGAEIPAAAGAGSLRIAALAFAVDGSMLAGVHYGLESGDGAVYRSVDGGDSWALVAAGLEGTSVLDVTSVPAGSMRLYAATMRQAPAGAGLWEIDIKYGGPAEPGTWTTAGPCGGGAQALAVSPSFASDGVILAGEWMQERGSVESGGGIYRSADGGATWQAARGGTEFVSGSLAVHGFAFSPDFAMDGTVFAATGGGVFRSADGGQSWAWASRLYDGPPGIITSVAAAPDYGTSGHVLAGKGWGGVAVSSDGGLNWTVHQSVGAMGAVAYSPNFAVDRVAFAGGWTSLSRTEDAGATWTEVLTATSVGVLAVSPAYAVTPTLFAGGEGIYVSDNGGTSWISTTLPGDPFLVTAIALSPAFPADPTLLAGSNEGLYRSGDGGATWEVVAGYSGGAVHAIALSPAWPGQATVLVGSDAGVYRSDDGGGHWTLLPGMAPLNVGAVAMAGSGLPVVGTERHGIYLGSAGGAGWVPLGMQQMSSHRVSALAPSPAYGSDGTILAALVSRLSIGASVWRTADGGGTWDMVYSKDYVGGLAVSPGFAQDGTTYAGGGQERMVRSTDGGTTWQPLGTWPGEWPPAVRTVALPPDYPLNLTVYAGGTGFWRLVDGATEWEAAALGLTAEKSVGSMAASPNCGADMTLLAVASWSEGAEQRSGVWRSVDGGLYWAPSNDGLVAEGVVQVAFSPRYCVDGTAYALAQSGLYRSLDGGQRWTRAGSPPEGATVQSLAVDDHGDVYVGTNQGVWRYRTAAYDVVINGGFEATGGWTLDAAWPAEYRRDVAFDGARSVYIGFDDEANSFRYSSARQAVSIPADAEAAMLKAYVYPVSGEAGARVVSPAWQRGQEIDAAGCPGDAQYLLLLDDQTGAVVENLFWERTNDRRWHEYTFDLAPYAGSGLVLHFGVCNDGEGGRTGMFVDDVSLVVRRSTAPADHAVYLPLVMRH